MNIKLADLSLEITELKRYQYNSMLDDGQSDLIDDQLKIMGDLVSVIKKRIEYDKEYLRAIGVMK